MKLLRVGLCFHFLSGRRDYAPGMLDPHLGQETTEDDTRVEILLGDLPSRLCLPGVAVLDLSDRLGSFRHRLDREQPLATGQMGRK